MHTVKVTRKPEYLWTIGGNQPLLTRFSDKFVREGWTVDPEFVVGESDERDDWPSVHPGPLNESTGYRELSAHILFSVVKPCDDCEYRLTLQAYEGAGPCPDLRVTVNGVPGLLLTRASRPDRAHNPVPPTPTAGVIERSLVIPSRLVREGDNRLTITTIAVEPPASSELIRQQRPELGWWFGSTLRWGALSMQVCDVGSDAIGADVEVLPLFVRRDPEGLFEGVDVIVEGLTEHSDTTLKFSAGDFAESVDLSRAAYQFGDVRARFFVPEFESELEAQVQVDRGEEQILHSSYALKPSRKWTLHLIPHVHLDVGYTDYQAKVIEVHSRNLEKALALFEQNDDYRFSVDGSMILEMFGSNRHADTYQAVVAALRQGRLSVNGFYALLLSGVASLEDLFQASRVSLELARESGVSISYANLTDVPSYSWALPSVLNAAGIHAFMGLANHIRGGNAESDIMQHRSPFRWKGPDGATVVAFFSDGYAMLRHVCGDPPTLTGMAQNLTRYVEPYERADYLPQDLPIVGTHADNEDLAHGYGRIVERWNAEYAWPRLRYSTIAEYFDTIASLEEQLEEVSGDGGSYWEDGVGTQACALAEYRRTEGLLGAAEALSAFVSLRQPRLVPNLVALDEAWRCQILATEHTWTAGHATQLPHSDDARDQLDWKVSTIARGARIAFDQALTGLSQLANLVELDDAPGLIVYNDLSYARDVLTEVQLKSGSRVEDETGNVLERFTETVDDDGLERVTVRVPQVPAFGYRMLRVRPDVEGRSADPADSIEQPLTRSIVTAHYAVEVAPRTGRIVGIRNRATGQELLDLSSAWSLGELLYVSGGGSSRGRGRDEELSSIFDLSPDLDPPRLFTVPATAGHGRLLKTPWGYRIRTTGSAPTIDSIVTEVDFFDSDSRVEVSVQIEKTPTLAKESVYIAFPFAFSSPTVHYDRQLGWVDPASDHLPGACNEWLAVQNGVVMEDDDGNAIALLSRDAPLLTFDEPVKCDWRSNFVAQSGTVLSWVMNNYWFTNTPAEQGGRLHLKYAFEPIAPGDYVTATKIAAELRSPNVSGEVRRLERCEPGTRPLSSSGMLLETDLPENILATVLASRREGLVVRVREVGGRPGSGAIRHPAPEADAPWARYATVGELDTEQIHVGTDGWIRFDLEPWGVRTIRLGARRSIA